jgi:hypothetical protein
MADGERPRAPLWPICTAPADGINASISGTVNYLRFYLAGLAGGQFNGTRLLSPGIIRAMQTPRVHAGRTEFG